MSFKGPDLCKKPLVLRRKLRESSASLCVCASAVTAVVPLSASLDAHWTADGALPLKVQLAQTQTRRKIETGHLQHIGALSHLKSKNLPKPWSTGLRSVRTAPWLTALDARRSQLGWFFAIYDAWLDPSPTSEAKRGRRIQTARELEPYKTNTFAANCFGAELKEASFLVKSFSRTFLLQICFPKWWRASRKFHPVNYQRKLTALRPFRTVCARLGMRVTTCGCLDRSWHFHQKGRFGSINDAQRRIFPHRLKQVHRSNI